MADFNFDIWRLQAQGDMQGLITLLRHANPDMRRRAATALRALGATSSIPALQAALVNEGDAEVRTVLVSALDYLFEQALDGENKQATDRQHKVVYWIAQLSSDKPEQIIRAAQNLADLKEKIAAEALVLIFRNRQHSARVRLAAAEALLKLESAPVEVTLLAALRHADWHTRRNAAGVLGQLHADWAVEALAGALRDPQEIVRRTAYAALRRIDTPESRRAMEPPTTAQPDPKPKGTALLTEPKKPYVRTPTQPLPPPPPRPPETQQPASPVDKKETPPPAEKKEAPPVQAAPNMPEDSLDLKPLLAPVPEKLPLPAPKTYSDEDTQPTRPILGEDVG